MSSSIFPSFVRFSIPSVGLSTGIRTLCVIFEVIRGPTMPR